VQEYEAGSSFEHLRRKYGIGGKTTIQKWVRHYSPWNEEENSARAPGEVQRLEERIQWLEKAVSELTIDKLLLQSTLEAYQEVYGEELVKKQGSILQRAHQQVQGQVAMTQLCHRMGISRQAHYQRLRRQMERQVDEEKILSQVRMVRRRHPCLGTRKLLVKLQPLMAQERLSIGRDRLFELLRGRDLLVSPRRRRCRRTTWAGTRRAPNRVAGHSIDRPDAVWVADITYLDLAVGGQFVYLFVLMDLYSRYVVGWNLASSLAAEHALEALQEAICQAPRPSWVRSITATMVYNTPAPVIGTASGSTVYSPAWEKLATPTTMHMPSACWEPSNRNMPWTASFTTSPRLAWP